MKKVTEEKQKHNNAAKLLQHEGSLAFVCRWCAWAICSDGTKRFVHLSAVES